MTPPELREAPVTRGDLGCLELTEWAAGMGLIAGVTARGTDFRLGSPQPMPEVRDRWRRLGAALGPGFDTIVVGYQCHGTTIATHQAPKADWTVLDQTDGHVTGRAGTLLSVIVADCVPVYLAEPKTGWIALLHAGWRGIAAGMVEQGVSRLSQLSGRPPADIVMHCGISICGECYEVGSEVYQAVSGEPTDGKRFLDLRTAIGGRAARSGLLRVTLSPWCTAHDGDRFYSHRGSGGQDGRMVAYLGRPSP